ncbi:MAG: hypothetical protein LBD42_07010 [Desulfovibrio sp.]|jgi:chromatin segregation and condensation protein Rec8/ScpA/Scc1 (kleisin family)|nr:hypothetical protein [Desulfovibrio sp.]
MLPVPVIQMGLVEKLAEVEQNQPYVQQLVAQENARQALQAEAERVPVTNASEQGKKIRDRNSGRKKQKRQRSSKQSSDERCAAQSEWDGADTDLAANNPWTGQIVDMKV